MNPTAGLQPYSLEKLRLMPHFLRMGAPAQLPDLATARLDDVFQEEGIKSRPMRFCIRDITLPFSGIVQTYTAEFTQYIIAARFNLQAVALTPTSFTVAITKAPSAAALGSSFGGDTSILEKTTQFEWKLESDPGYTGVRGVRGPMGFYLNMGETISLAVIVQATVTGPTFGTRLGGSALLVFKPTGRQQQ